MKEKYLSTFNRLLYTRNMKKILVAFLAIALSITLPAAHANVAPQADVSCSFSSTGVSYAISMVFSGGAISFNQLSYEWEYSIAPAGTNPQLTSSYGPRTSFKTTLGNGLDLTYEEMLTLARNDVNASILIHANSIFSAGSSTITNKNGKGCYVDLPPVLSNREKMAAQQAAANKAAADATAKAAADAATKAAMDKAEADAVSQVRVESIFQVLALRNSEIDSKAQETISKFPTTAGNIKKFLLSRPLAPSSITADLTVSSIQNSLDALSAFKGNLDTFIASMTKSLPRTITCAKGKTLKKVTGSRPKCPTGYKQR